MAMEFERAENRASRELLLESQVESVVSDIVEGATGREIQFVSVDDWFNRWLTIKEVKSEATYATYKGTVERFCRFLGERSKMRLSLLSIDDVVAFRDAELKTGKVARTVNAQVKHLRIALNLARIQGHVKTNVAEAVESLKEKRDFRRDVFTPDMVEELLAATFRLAANPKAQKAAPAYREWRGLVLVGFFTGLRLSDAAGLLWADIDLKNRMIDTETRKTQERIVIPLHAQLEAYLSEHVKAKTSNDDRVFEILGAKKTSGNGGLSTAFARIMKEAGIQGTRVDGQGKGRARNSLSFHAFRHSFNSALMNAGVNQETRQLLTGHRSKEMNDIYTHASTETLRDAVTTIPSLTIEAAKS